MTSLSTAPAGSQLSLSFAYDYKGRRIQKTVSTWNNPGYIPQSSTAFVYDGWNLTAELSVLNVPSPALLRSYFWGLDLSGSPQGAGGVGGLLEVASYTTPATNCFVAFDGNGNVGALISAADASIAAQYEYGPFGEVIRITGPMARVDPSRFSTRYQDDETDLLYYGDRYLNVSTGGFLSRDPLAEAGERLLLDLSQL